MRVVSASRAIIVLFVVLALAAVFVPRRLHRPLWVEAEAVVGVWWLVWAGVLSWMLYAGIGLRHYFSTRAHQTNESSSGWAGRASTLPPVLGVALVHLLA